MESAQARKRRSVPFLLLLNDGDTLVYIDPAPEDRNKFTATPTIIHRVNSSTLQNTKSEYFANAFTPRNQERVRRRRGFANRLPDGVKYVIDLTPPLLEDEAIIHMTEVSCPKAIRLWASQKKRWDLPRSCVGGDDEYEQNGSVSSEPVFPLVVGDREEIGIEQDEGVEQEDIDEFEGSQFHDFSEVPATLPLEYSAKRHLQGIDQVLHALHGLHVVLDTPCKLWTFFAVAKLFDVATVPIVSGWIFSWFYEEMNVYFLQVHPDIAYRVACGIKSTSLCQDAFKFLVSDEALIHIVRSAHLTPRKEWSFMFAHSLIEDSLDDTEVQRIEYASKSFADRIINEFLFLVGSEMSWLLEISQFAILAQYKKDHPEHDLLLMEFRNLLKIWVRSGIYRILSDAKDPLRCSYDNPSTEPAGIPGNFFPRSSLIQRLLSRAFWVDLLTAQVNLATSWPVLDLSRTSVKDLGEGLSAFEGQSDARIAYIPEGNMYRLVAEFNQVIKLQHTARQETHTKEGTRSGQVQPAEDTTDEATLRMNCLTRDLQKLAISPDPVALNLHERFGDEEDESFDILSDLTSHGGIDLESKFPKQFHMRNFVVGVSVYIGNHARRVLYEDNNALFRHSPTTSLTSLREEEFRYLPLWAGGNDDGSGGVFTDHILPIVEAEGFSAPGPGVLTGAETPKDSFPEDSIDNISRSEAMSTVQRASHIATFSHASEVESLGSFKSDFGGLQLSEGALMDHDMLNDENHLESITDENRSHSDGVSTIMPGSSQLSGLSDDEMEVDLMKENEATESDGYELVSDYGD